MHNHFNAPYLQGEAKNTDTALQKTIPSYADLRFQSGTLQILDNKGGAQTFNGIEYIVTYNEIKGVSFVSASNALVMLRGFGGFFTCTQSHNNTNDFVLHLQVF